MKQFRLLLAMLLLGILLPARAARPVTSGEDLMRQDGRIYVAADAAFPAVYADIARWRAGRAAVPRASLFGGAYWLVAEVRNDSAVEDWVLAPGSVLFDQAAIRIYASDGTVQHLQAGHRADYQYALHYGQRIRLAPGASAVIIERIDSPFYQAPPSLRLFTEAEYRRLTTRENALILGSLGALGALAVFNLFVHLMKPDRATFYYSVYLFIYLIAWAQEFHLPAHLLGWHDLHWIYVPFFLMALPNTAFYVEFLQLRQHHPRLAKLSRVNYVLPLLMLPSTVLALPYAPILATLTISVWLSLALTCGIVSLRAGNPLARYYVLAFCALMVPATLILPSNFGLVAPPVYNPELLTLLGGTLEALLLAFALAHKLRLLAREKEFAVHRLNQSIVLAHTDHLTGIANRHAFDQQLALRYAAERGGEGGEDGLALLLIDLDGLKAVNDRDGHARGDALLRDFAQGLKQMLREDVGVFRLGGDEFTILAAQRHVADLLAALQRLEGTLRQRSYPHAGASVGWATAAESPSSDDMVALADERMYEHKNARRRSRASDALASR
ncbi:diguanylate cyclase (GGDEF) domain-containing protein [Duganella sp. CF517]|uniref:GGDEF domain-containing protein n=1 Tax=Duganella sp. CF517 TaxID=1881038 RepID=UPI0008B00928|nr:GGDEF domain-containing protein [Duganella sp. CF517]SEN08004.1 diguanylate cyclase (GGDEF) domain-containing protein [Duganella sp. CF517]